MIYLVVLIYLVGCVVSYIILKKNEIRVTGTWTVRKRIQGMILSMFSYVMWLIMLIIYIEENVDFDKPAKW